MNKTIICESHLKEKITFSYDFPFFLESTEGLHEVSGTIISVKSAYAVGENYVNTNIEKRNIIIGGIFKDDLINNRLLLYRLFPLKTIGTLYYCEEEIKRKIEYRVEDVRVDDKGYPRKFQISLIALYPFFKDIASTRLQMATWIPLLKFPLKIPINEGIKFGMKNKTLSVTVKNESNLEFGMIITFKANDKVVNPSMFNVNSREEIKINKEMKSGDRIVVYTHRQNKNIYFIHSDTGEIENINNYMVYGSKFLQIHKGSNTFRFNADNYKDNLEAIIEYQMEYEAV